MRFSQPRRPRDLEDALIPLINVVFLMLIFFMLAGQIHAPDALHVDPPVSEQGQSEIPGAIQVLLDANGRAALDGEVLTDEALAARIEQRLDAWRTRSSHATAGLTGAAERSETADDLPAVTVKADAAVRHLRLRKLLDQLRAAGVERVRLLSQSASG
jgi:biopolymer transport protein ExbD